MAGSSAAAVRRCAKATDVCQAGRYDRIGSEVELAAVGRCRRIGFTEGTPERCRKTSPRMPRRPVWIARSIYAVRHAATHLVEACYIVIAGFVGMRVSEILSMEVGAIEFRAIGETGVKQAYVVARLFKTVDQHGGRLERWIAPEPVVTAVKLLEQLSAPFREVSGRRELFLVKNTQYGEIVPVTQMHIGWRINDFARHVGVPLHEGKPWPSALTSSANLRSLHRA
ncbi:hypothetical protein [Mesorhizobium japonicum]|uniref:Mlr9302 protein n=1 Tax=Mesorhizobium japonicum (strain LMG 29417 / CECT 9101 / MAFF 303099) TaxID=266835 RepID=Q981N4_RHILO|nr:hypothetical protein [Mesorhizobium japonicum]BAB54675.1 mlr9302 [Mesorhizobium japonicum MAFF 303099]